MPTDVVTRLRGNSGIRPVDVVTKLRGRSSPDRVDVITRLRGSGAQTLTVRFAPPMKTTANPFEVISLTVAPSMPVDTVAVTQTAGPAVTILGTGLDRSAKMPAKLTSNVLTFQAVVTKAGYPTATTSYSITVAAHGGLYRKNGEGVQWRTYQAASTLPKYSDTYTDSYSGVDPAPATLPYPGTYTPTY